VSKKSTNAGVQTGTGIEFQKHCALYLLIDNWEKHKDKKYFIAIEHHDDFLFCYKDEDELVEHIETYQAKKSSEPWGMTQKFYKILQKILEVGKSIKSDPITKSSSYYHELFFLTNDTIKIPKNYVNETNQVVKYIDLPITQKTQISSGIGKINSDLSEIDNLHFCYIDFSRTSKEQKRQLVGLIKDVFEDRIADHKAALDTLLELFRDVELTYNQGNQSKLLDESKQVDSDKINEAINVITTKNKAFGMWRDKKSELSQILTIPVSQQKDFEMHFENSFDYFKDMTKTEHQKIFNFVEKNKSILDTCYSDEECIENLYSAISKQESIRQEELYIKAAIFAAYVEIKDMQ
jgi:hypothetical protein